MPIYEHNCRQCNIEWEEEYSLDVFEAYRIAGKNLACPKCKSRNTYRSVTTSGAVHFKGAGWSPDGYYKNQAYDTHKAEGKSVQLYDRKEDIERDLKGEAAVREKGKLKKEDAAARRHLSPDAGLTQDEADKRIQAAVDKVVVQ